MLRNAVFTACVTAMISAAVMTLAPDGRKRELRFICTLVLISSLAAGVLGSGKAVSASLDLPTTGELEFSYENMLLTRSRVSIEREVTERLKAEGYEVQLVSIDVSFDEYNYIKTDRVGVVLGQLAEENEVVRAVREIVGGEAEVTVVAAGDEELIY